MSASHVPSALHRHTSSACAAVRSLAVAVSVVDDERLVLGYVLDADLKGLRIPAEAAAQRAHELWTHTCFEAFLGVTGAGGLCKFYFPPLAWWAYVSFRRGGERRAGRPRPPRSRDRRAAHCNGI